MKKLRPFNQVNPNNPNRFMIIRLHLIKSLQNFDYIIFVMPQLYKYKISLDRKNVNYIFMFSRILP